MSVKRTSIDGSEPIKLAEAKEQCYETGSKWDSYLTALITVVREYAENDTWRSIVESTWEYRLDAFPDDDGEINIPKPPILSVSKIEYVDGEGTTQTLADSEYNVDTDSEYGRVEPEDSWPDTKDTYNAVIITFTAGYDGNSEDRKLPKPLKQGMLMLLKHLFDNRESVIMSEGNTLDIKEVPKSTDILLGFYNARTFV